MGVNLGSDPRLGNPHDQQAIHLHATGPSAKAQRRGTRHGRPQHRATLIAPLSEQRRQPRRHLQLSRRPLRQAPVNFFRNIFPADPRSAALGRISLQSSIRAAATCRRPIPTRESGAVDRTLLAGTTLAVLGVFFLGRDALSYVGTSVGWIKDSVKNSVPIDFELQRARRLIKNLVPDIRQNMHRIAAEEVEVQRLAADRRELIAARARSRRNHAAEDRPGRQLRFAEVRRALLFGRRRQSRSFAPLRALQDARSHARQPGSDAASPAAPASRRPGRSWKACWPRSGNWRSTSSISKPG